MTSDDDFVEKMKVAKTFENLDISVSEAQERLENPECDGVQGRLYERIAELGERQQEYLLNLLNSFREPEEPQPTSVRGKAIAVVRDEEPVGTDVIGERLGVDRSNAGAVMSNLVYNYQKPYVAPRGESTPYNYILTGDGQKYLEKHEVEVSDGSDDDGEDNE